MIAVIDYDAGNIKSVEKALISLGQDVCVTREKGSLFEADGLILPGVGSFGDAMAKLHSYGLTEIIKEIIGRGTPFLGICLGLQLLFERSEESPGVEGLGILRGSVVRIPSDMGLKVPHIGWNDLQLPGKGRLFAGIDPGVYVYFVHSYYLQAEKKEIVKATAQYGVTVEASVEQDNVFACQFHPEKSSDAGLRILKNFLTVSG